MNPSKSILDRSFVWVPPTATSVEKTWRLYGWLPITDEERQAKIQAANARNPARKAQ